MISFDNSENAKNAPKYYCEKCNFKCFKKSNFAIHCSTRKHLNDNNAGINDNNLDISENNKLYICKCGKSYKHASGLSRHKANNNCLNTEFESQELTLNSNMIEILEKEKDEITISDAKLVFELLKQNNEFKELILNQSNQMIEQNKSMIELFKNNSITTTNNIVNGNVNTQNTQFNIQMYLNETCKNAMTIDEFLDYLQPTVEELEATARLGYVEGITRIIMRGLKDLEEELRPFHCSDLKRETLFVKNPDGEWEKETEEKNLMLEFVKAVGRKNFNNVNKWRQEHPNCRYHDSKSNDMLNQILLNSTSGRTEEEQMASYKKIIKNITKEVVIDKSKKNKSKYNNS
jgi:hypothetical protein